MGPEHETLVHLHTQIHALHRIHTRNAAALSRFVCGKVMVELRNGAVDHMNELCEQDLKYWHN